MRPRVYMTQVQVYDPHGHTTSVWFCAGGMATRTKGRMMLILVGSEVAPDARASFHRDEPDHGHLLGDCILPYYGPCLRQECPRSYHSLRLSNAAAKIRRGHSNP